MIFIKIYFSKSNLKRRKRLDWIQLQEIARTSDFLMRVKFCINLKRNMELQLLFSARQGWSIKHTMGDLIGRDYSPSMASTTQGRRSAFLSAVPRSSRKPCRKCPPPILSTAHDSVSTRKISRNLFDNHFQPIL